MINEYDIYKNKVEPGNRVLLCWFGHLKDCFYLYNIKNAMVFSVYVPSKDPELKDIKFPTDKWKEVVKEKRYNPLYHNSYVYYRHMYNSSYYIIDKGTLPEQLKRFLKVKREVD